MTTNDLKPALMTLKSIDVQDFHDSEDQAVGVIAYRFESRDGQRAFQAFKSDLDGIKFGDIFAMSLKMSFGQKSSAKEKTPIEPKEILESLIGHDYWIVRGISPAGFGDVARILLPNQLN